MAVHLPVELLNQIFELAIPTPDEAVKMGRISFSHCPWSLTHVCSQWRAVALSMPVLWSCIAISIPNFSEGAPPYPLELVKAQIHRSLPRPLEVIFLSKEAPTTTAHTTKTLFKLIHGACDRWETARIEWCLWNVLPLQGADLPLLRELCLHILYWNANRIPAPPPVTRKSPNLTKITFDGSDMQLRGLGALDLSALEDLTIGGYTLGCLKDVLSGSKCSLRKLWLKHYPPAPEVLEILTLNPSIRELKLSRYDRHRRVVTALTLAEIPDQGVVYAPALTTFSIEWTEDRELRLLVDMVESRVRLFHLHGCAQLQRLCLLRTGGPRDFRESRDWNWKRIMALKKAGLRVEYR
ncbi:hypothetical protein C8R46DRAFT_1235141 [Mycena filopes]|nr:hypothetical protein C8R46DRAFT_1235141 [Mycena filopes]